MPLLRTAYQHRARAAQLRAQGTPRAVEIAEQYEMLARMIDRHQARLTPSQIESLRSDKRAAIKRLDEIAAAKGATQPCRALPPLLRAFPHQFHPTST